MGGVPYVKVKRKGQKFPKWERMVALKDCPQISPFHLLQAYVAATANYVQPGGPVLISLRPPYRPLKADSVASITRRGLQKFGVDPHVWGPHSTRGAGVGLMKKTGPE